MQPSTDALVGKTFGWDEFEKNEEWLLKSFNLRYNVDGVYVKERKNGKSAMRECRNLWK